jgi:hypothetical protein
MNEHQAEMEPTVEEERDYWQRMANQHSVKIMSLSKEYNYLLEELAALRSQVVVWRDGGARGGVLPTELTHGMPILAWAKLDAHPVAVSFLIDEFGKWFAPLPGTHCDIEWEDISKWCPLSEIPTPRD